MVVVKENVATAPSFTAELEAAREYVGTPATLEVSLIRMDAVLLCRLMVNVSMPSVKLSEAMGTETVAIPAELTVVKPVKAPPVISEDVTPDSVYAMLVPAVTLDVVMVKSAVEPSFTDELLEETAYVGVTAPLEVS